MAARSPSRVTRGGRRIALVLGAALLHEAILASSVMAAMAPGPAGLLPPIAVDDTATAVHGKLRTVAAPGILANDLQLGGGYTAVLVSGVRDGTLDLDPDGGYTYRSSLDFVGTDEFTYKVDGGLLGLSNVATVTITVTNTAPVANPDAYTAVADVEKSIPAPGLLANDDDADGDSLTIDIVSEPANGNLNERDDGSFRYTADEGFSGTDTFRYRAWDGVAWSNTVTVTITVSSPATPTPTPTRTPSPTASPTPSPILPVPIPSLPLPTLPLATPTPTPRPSAAPTPAATAGTTPSATPSGTPSPATSTGPSPMPPGSSPSTPGAAPSTGPNSEPPDGSVVPSVGGGGSTDGSTGGDSSGRGSSGAPGSRPGLDGPFSVGGTEPGPDLVLDTAAVAFGGFEWAVPALVLTVPGLLLIVAVLAQATIGLAFLPVARRWLGADRRRRREAPQTA